ncbi:hypothetical protein SOV_35190 [Sporomusa ovata DSM 2662]|uniref:hypothetical protein n=1 Tax=Sporomusa ovata TaxID=2378 RepID=UPI0030CE6E77
MAIHYTQKFKEDAVVYYNDHKDLGVNGCAKNLGISKISIKQMGKCCKRTRWKSTNQGSG